jgi:enterochelin esterase-like enzyme
MLNQVSNRILIFENMQAVNVPGISVENRSVLSVFLSREVKLDFYLPKNIADLSEISLLLINDGQNMKELGLENMLEKLYAENAIRPLLCVAIHAGPHRKMEYGVSSQPDYLGRGLPRTWRQSRVLYLFYRKGITSFYQGYL